MVQFNKNFNVYYSIHYFPSFLLKCLYLSVQVLSVYSCVYSLHRMAAQPPPHNSTTTCRFFYAAAPSQCCHCVINFFAHNFNDTLLLGKYTPVSLPYCLHPQTSRILLQFSWEQDSSSLLLTA